MKIKIIFILILISLVISAFPARSYASDEIGVILVIDSSDTNSSEISEKVKSYLKLLRELNEPVFGKNIFWIKTYDYNDSTFVPFCTLILKIEKSKVTFAGLSRLNDDYTFREFIPDKSVSNISNPLDASYKLIDFFKQVIPEERAKKLITRLTGIKTVISEPAGAEVVIDGVSSGKTPLNDLLLKPGKHNITLKLDDYIDLQKEVNIEENKFEDISFSLEKINAFIDISTKPDGAEISLNGKPDGMTPLNRKIIPGKYKIEIRKDGFKTFEKTYEIKNNSTLKKEIKLLPGKARIYVECNGYYVKEFRKIDMHRTAEITRTIFKESLTEKINEIIGKEKEMELVNDKNNTDYLVMYEAWPKIPLKGKMKIVDIRTDKTVMEKEGNISISFRASDSTCAEKAAELFEKKLLPDFREYIRKQLTYPE